MYDNFLQALSSVKIGGVGDNFFFPPVDQLVITTNHFNHLGEFTGQDLATISLAGIEIVLSCMISMAVITYFIVRKK